MSDISDLVPLPDGARRPRRDPDPYGQAALLLVESLIHGMIAKAALSVEEAVEIIEVAADIKIEMADATHERAEVLAESLALLEAIAGSLMRDVRKGPLPG